MRQTPVVIGNDNNLVREKEWASSSENNTFVLNFSYKISFNLLDFDLKTVGALDCNDFEYRKEKSGSTLPDIRSSLDSKTIQPCPYVCPSFACNNYYNDDDFANGHKYNLIQNSHSPQHHHTRSKYVHLYTLYKYVLVPNDAYVLRNFKSNESRRPFIKYDAQVEVVSGTPIIKLKKKNRNERCCLRVEFFLWCIILINLTYQSKKTK
ncbi:hypothetical protein FF38_05778 [Lucilia cuprina]|uniref:Uncharacterized protein n=1 Tax=Lucilia cuprina TaxID=7375 RepID=A0A0L0C7X2_LUCCU|nr:hypothetical protein FF38_05778 [Lucilia cuprina]